MNGKNDFSYDKNISFFNNISLFEKINIVVFYTHFMKKTKNIWNLNMHSHSFYELHIVLNGSCVMNMGKYDIKLEKNDYILIPCGIKHSFGSCDEKFFRFSVAFDIVFDENQTVLSNVEQKGRRLDNKSIFYVKNIVYEYKNSKIGSQNIINAEISSLLIGILRSCDVLTLNCVSDSVTQPILRKAILFIENNISRKITVGEVAKNVFLSTRHLNRIFSDNFGMTVTRYIKTTKIMTAKEYLKKTDFSIKETACLVGAESEAYFCKFFKKETGLSPKNYRLHS